MKKLIAFLVIVGIVGGITYAIVSNNMRKAAYMRAAEEAFKRAGEGGIKPEKYLEELDKALDEIVNASDAVINGK